MEELFVALAAGALGGIVRSIWGWAANAYPSGDKFDFVRLAKSVARAVIGGAVFAFGLGLDPVSTFFAAFSADILWKEGSQVVDAVAAKNQKPPTVPAVAAP